MNMLKPQDSPTRETITLDGLFAFKVDFDRAGLFLLPSTRMMPGAVWKSANDRRPKASAFTLRERWRSMGGSTKRRINQR